MCRVKAMASSVERLLRYANCSGSSEAGSTEQMCSLTSFSKHLLKMGVRATGLQSFKHVILFFFAMGTMVDFFYCFLGEKPNLTTFFLFEKLSATREKI